MRWWPLSSLPLTSPPLLMLELRAHYACLTGTEGASVPWLPPGPSPSRWFVLKSREIGPPAQRLCEAELLSNAQAKAWEDEAEAQRAWELLPGSPRPALLPHDKASNCSAKLHVQPTYFPQVCPSPPVLSPGLSHADSFCRSVLFVACLLPLSSSRSPTPRPSPRDFLIKKATADQRGWQATASRSIHGSHAGGKSSACLQEHIRIPTPRVLTAQGLSAAMQSGVCSRACAAARMRFRIAFAKGHVKSWPCLLGNHPHCVADQRTLLLVVSHWKGDASWLADQPFCYLVYEKYEAKDSYIDFATPNKANEASSYLHFLASQYHQLPDSTIFLQDHQSSLHSANMVHILRQLRLDAHPYLPLNSIYMPFLEPRDFCNVRKCIAASGLTHFINASTLPTHHMDVAFTCCAQFLVSREAVLSRPKEMYERLLQYTLAATDFGQRSDSFARGECLEVLWHVIFGSTLIEEPLRPSEKCGKVNSMCQLRSGLESFVPLNDSFWSWSSETWSRLSRREQIAVRHRPEGALFQEAIKQGTLCLLPTAASPDGSLLPTSTNCMFPSDAGIHKLLHQPHAQLVTIRNRTHARAEITANCSLMDTSSGSRRKLVNTLKQFCIGAQPAKRRTSIKFFRQVLCLLFEREVELLRELRRAPAMSQPDNDVHLDFDRVDVEREHESTDEPTPNVLRSARQKKILRKARLKVS